MSEQRRERLATEIDLLEAMYPNQVTFAEKTLELKYVHKTATLSLRLPDLYPVSGFPDIISANDTSKNDMRNIMKAEIEALSLVEGEESLDAIIARFQEMIDENSAAKYDSINVTSVHDEMPGSKTIVIWLHHLLAASKRKLTLTPALPGISGITKPGYPGVMIFSGPASAVNDHVNTLKQENWQAFQVRYEEEGQLWEFEHIRGIKEVETMGEVVKSIDISGVGRREEFLKAMGIK